MTDKAQAWGEGLVFYVRSSKLKGTLYPTNTHIAAWLFFVPRRQDTLLKMLLAAARHANFFIFADQHIICCFLISLDLANYFLTSSDWKHFNMFSYLSKILQLRAASRNMANIVKIITTPKTAYDFEGHMLYLNDKLCLVHLHFKSILRVALKSGEITL
ncbi:hypothetical protein ACJX0J_022840, partial [Zea mays]